MNKHKFCGVIVSVFISMFILLQGFADSPVVLNTNDYGVNPFNFTESLSTLAKDQIRVLSDLDYMGSQQIVLPVPGTGYELIYHWGFLGSGDLFSPLPQVKAQFRPIIETQENSNDNAILDLGKVMVKNELFKKSKNFPLIKWLSDSEISPIKLFFVKVLLLLKNSSSLGMDNIKCELFRLLFRLSLVESIVLFDTSKPLTARLPDIIQIALDEISPEIGVLIDDVWRDVLSSRGLVQNMQSDGDLTNITAYVFNDSSFAKKCFDNLCMSKDVHLMIEQSINSVGYTLISLDDLIDISSIQSSNAVLNPAMRLVGKKSFGVVNLSCGSSGLPAAVYNKMQEQASQKVFFVLDVDGKAWIVCKGGRLDVIETAKLFSAALVVTFKDYINARKRVMASTKSEARSYQLLLKHKEQEYVHKMNFMTSPYGKLSADRLSREIARVDIQGDVQINEQIVQENKERQHELDLLKNELIQEQGSLMRLNRARDLSQNSQARRLAMLAVDSSAKRCSELEEKIKIIEQKISLNDVVVVDVSASNTMSDSQKRIEYQQNIDMLQKMLKNQFLDSVQRKEIQDCISKLENSMNELTLANQKKDTSDYLKRLLVKRSNIANVYEQEAMLLKTELASLRSGLSKIVDESIRMAKTIELANIEKDFELYILSLKDTAEKIIIENNKLVELESCKQRFTDQPKTFVDQNLVEKIQELEQEVGYLMRLNAGSWIRNLIQTSGDIQGFLDDLQSDSLEEFRAVKDRFFSRLSFIVKNSDHISENILFYRHLVGLIMPEFIPSFDLCSSGI